MGSQLNPLPFSRIGSRERASKSQLSATWLCGTLKWVSPHDLGARQYRRCCIGHTKPYCVSSLHWCRKAFACSLCKFYNCYMVSTIVLKNLSSSQSIVLLFFLGSLSWNTCSFVILFLISTLTSTTFTYVIIIFTLAIIFLLEVDANFPWNIFCIFANLGQIVILCPFKPKIWHAYEPFIWTF